MLSYPGLLCPRNACAVTNLLFNIHFKVGIPIYSVTVINKLNNKYLKGFAFYEHRILIRALRGYQA
jgi:hypothetical protein